MSQFALDESISYRDVIEADDLDTTPPADNQIIKGTKDLGVFVSMPSGTTAMSLTPMLYDAATGLWFTDDSQTKTFAAVGNYFYVIKTYGSKMFIRVDSMTGSAASIRYKPIAYRSV